MKLIKIKDRCTKLKLKKSSSVIKLFDKVSIAYSTILEHKEDIEEVNCNIPLEEILDGKYMTDFFCKKTNGEYMVRECVYRSQLVLPRTLKLLDASYEYWNRRGVTDWGVVTDKEIGQDE